MARLAPVSRSEFIRKLKSLGYEGPFVGGAHEYMAKPGRTPVRVPNPHSRQGGGIGVGLLSRILRDANIDRDAWENA